MIRGGAYGRGAIMSSGTTGGAGASTSWVRRVPGPQAPLSRGEAAGIVEALYRRLPVNPQDVLAMASRGFCLTCVGRRGKAAPELDRAIAPWIRAAAWPARVAGRRSWSLGCMATRLGRARSCSPEQASHFDMGITLRPLGRRPEAGRATRVARPPGPKRAGWNHQLRRAGRPTQI